MATQSPRLRRAIGLTAVPALALATLAALPATPAYAADPLSAPVVGGATWLKGQLTSGLLHNDQFNFDDYGLTIDAGLALVEIGGHGTTVDAISGAVASGIGNYVGDGTTESYAGAVAKASVFARAAGDDPAAYGGVNLVDRLEDRVLTDGVTAGRIQDLSNFGDFANVIGQSYAVRTLDEANSTLTNSATEFLLDQQCAEGFFRQDFSAIDAGDQTCNGDAGAEPSTDVTALAVLQLQGQSDDSAVQSALTSATAWLLDQQNPDGSFGSSPDIDVSNANSTGLAAWALRESGASTAATEAAEWVQALQVTELGACSGSPLGASTGAIAYDEAAMTLGTTEGITIQRTDQWRRATAQALPALLSLGDLPVLGAVQVTGPTGYQRAGSTVTLNVSGLGENELACLAGPGAARSVSGPAASAQVTLPAGTGNRRYALVRLGPSASTVLKVLGAKTLKFEAKDRVARGEKQVVKLRGLAVGERYKVKYRGSKVGAGKANTEGRATVRFPVGRKLGEAEILVIGEFANRRGKKTFRVIR
jgi:hypothetical protein